MKNNKWGIIGLIATGVGLVVNLVSAIAGNKREEEIIDKKVNEALARMTKPKEG